MNTLVGLIADNRDALFPTSKLKQANATSQTAWESVRTRLIAAHPGLEVTVAQIKTKWSKVKSDANQSVQDAKR